MSHRMAFNWNRSTNPLQVFLPPTPVQSVTCRWIPLCLPYANSSDSAVNELKLSWRTARHTDGTAVPAKVTAAIPAVPKYTEYQTEFLAVMIFLFGIQLLITTDNILPVLTSTVLLLCGHLADINPRDTNGVVLSVWWRHWREILRRISTVKTARTSNLCWCSVYPRSTVELAMS